MEIFYCARRAEFDLHCKLKRNALRFEAQSMLNLTASFWDYALYEAKKFAIMSVFQKQVKLEAGIINR
jgi:hypothetical protein